MTPDELCDQHIENQLMKINLERIDRLSRRSLLKFLDQERDKANTERLRKRARLIAIEQDSNLTFYELTKVENSL